MYERGKRKLNVKIDNVAFTFEKLFLYHIYTVYFSSQFEIKLTINEIKEKRFFSLVFPFFRPPFPYEIIIYDWYSFDKWTSK